MKPEKKQHTVFVRGVTYVLSSHESDEMIQKSAALVDETMRNVMDGSGNGKDLRQIATLVALRFATKALLLEEELKSVEIRSAQLIEQIADVILVSR